MRLKSLNSIKKKRKTKNSKTLHWPFDKRDQMGKPTFWLLWRPSMEAERRKRVSQKRKKVLEKRSEKQQSKNEKKMIVLNF
jgi:hypothetical protein